MRETSGVHVRPESPFNFTRIRTRNASEALESQFLIIDTFINSISISGLYVLLRDSELYEATNATVLPTGETIFNQHQSEAITMSHEKTILASKFIAGLTILQI